MDPVLESFSIILPDVIQGDDDGWSDDDGDDDGLDSSDADDANLGHRLTFPTNKLFGRENELEELLEFFSSLQENSSAGVVFLGGFSGTGKSAIVKEFIQQVLKKTEKNPVFISGKYSQMNAGEPFSAISHSINQYILHLSSCESDLLHSLAERLKANQIFLGSDLAVILADALFPALDDFWKKLDPESYELHYEKASTKTKRKARGAGSPLHAIKYAFRLFVHSLASDTCSRTMMPLILFMDDLQWADDASFQLLTHLMEDHSLTNLLLMGAYRLNEVKDKESFSNMMKKVHITKGNGLMKQMEVKNLSPESVAQFISASIDRSIQDVGPIAHAVYSKTLGNMFFVQQALEDLVRKNVLYFDLVFFRWELGDVTGVEMENFISDDVIEMLQSKLEKFPLPLQKALAIVAYTENAIQLSLLTALLRAESIHMDSRAVQKMMERALLEGVVLPTWDIVGGGDINQISYQFAHDHLREVACGLVKPGHERHQLLLRISKVLLERGSHKKDDWMLFVAARNLNSIPFSLTNAIQMASLNLKVGIIAASKGAFNEAIVFLRAGESQLDPVSCWDDHYKLTLSLKNNLMETEHFLGNEDRALEVAKEIIQNTKSLPEKSRAQCCCVEVTHFKNNRNYVQTLEAALGMLRLYGMELPNSPTDNQVSNEIHQLKQALHGSSLLRMAEFPIATEELFIAKVKIASLTLLYAHFARKDGLAMMLSYRLLRETLASKSITKDVPHVCITLAMQMRMEQKYDEGCAFADAGKRLMERFPEEKGIEFLRAKMSYYGIVGSLRMMFRDTITIFSELTNMFLMEGEIEFSFGSGFSAVLAFLCASIPLNPLLEPKLLDLEERASICGRNSFTVLFRLFRQCLYNLQGGPKSSSDPVKLTGTTFNEDEVLTLLEGDTRNMMFRDVSIVRLCLSVIYNDEVVMEEMLDRLDKYPIADLSPQRQHFRMSFTGLAAIILSRRPGKFTKWANTCAKFFKKLTDFGSPNARPVYCCMMALQNPSIETFDEAISVCSDLSLFHLAALMNERCGLMLLQSKQRELYQEYLKRALSLYYQWGAMQKVEQLTMQHEFLGSAMKQIEQTSWIFMRDKHEQVGSPTSVESGD